MNLTILYQLYLLFKIIKHLNPKTYLYFADALEIGTIYKVSIPLFGKKHLILTNPLSITYLIPFKVIEVSAMLVEIITFLSSFESTFSNA